MIDFVEIVIPSTKKKVLNLHFLNCPISHRISVVHVYGISKAGNKCFDMVDSGLVVLTGDDIIIDPAAWSYLLAVQPGEFAMLETGDFPINGIMAIHKEDFVRIGGFGEAQKYGSSDREFYSNAVRKGLKYLPIPLRLVKHIRHETRSSNIHKALWVSVCNTEFVMRNFLDYPGLVLKHDLLNRLRRRQFRTLLMQTVAFFWVVFFKGLSDRNGVKK